jgi:GTP cyclohydrolase IB
MIARTSGYEAVRAATPLPDVQAFADLRQVGIDRVGVTRVRYPIAVVDGHGERQPTIATVDLFVELPHQERGTHMSRFLEVLHEFHEFGPGTVPELLRRLRERLRAPSAHLAMEFPYFVRKEAPVSGAVGLMEFTCGYRASAGWDTDVIATLKAPVATLCPCSREISESGAHNQRGIVDVQVRARSAVPFDELIGIAEAGASCALYPVLKRTDEKWVTERAYANPRFVEDVLREITVTLRDDPRITWYRVEVENHESIHAHNAYAAVERWK